MPLPSLQPLLLGVKKPLLVGPPPPPPPAAPFLLAVGNQNTITAGAAPRVATLATAPAGSTIVLAILGLDGASVVSMSPGGLGFTAGDGSRTPYPPNAPFYNGYFNTYQSDPLATALAAGSALGPNFDYSGRIHMLAFCIPGATARDPETPSVTDDTSGGTNDFRRTTRPANASQPQVVSVFVLTTSNGNHMFMDAGLTQLGGDGAMDAGSATFGIKGGYKKLTATGGSESIGAVFDTGWAGGTGGTAAQRTTSVIA